MTGGWVTDPETGEQVWAATQSGGGWSYPVTQAGTQAKLAEVVAASERLIDEMRDAGRRSSSSEADWKAARARTFLRLKGSKNEEGLRFSEADRDAAALLENEQAFRDYLASDREFTVLREANDAYDRIVQACQTLAADLRPLVSEVRR